MNNDPKQEFIDAVLNIVRHTGSDFVEDKIRTFIQERISEPVVHYELISEDDIELGTTECILYGLDGVKK